MTASNRSFVNKDKISIGFMGDGRVGKSTLINVFNAGSFDAKPAPTHACQFSKSELEIANEYYQLEIIDTSGSNYEQFIPGYLKSCDFIFVVYDTTNKETFDSIEKRIASVIKEAKKQNIKEPSFILVGTKSDLDNDRQVSPDDAKEKAKKLGIDEKLCFEVSAKKDAANVNAPFIAAVKDVMALRSKVNIAPPPVVITPETKPSLLKRFRDFFKTAFLFISKKLGTSSKVKTGPATLSTPSITHKRLEIMPQAVIKPAAAVAKPSSPLVVANPTDERDEVKLTARPRNGF